ncbi:MAG: hypothetical protein JWN05_2560, partial [Arthrobacter sp.]|nr:hypothetical protein [Arthrobacter sp.]
MQHDGRQYDGGIRLGMSVQQRAGQPEGIGVWASLSRTFRNGDASSQMAARSGSSAMTPSGSASMPAETSRP